MAQEVSQKIVRVSKDINKALNNAVISVNNSEPATLVPLTNGGTIIDGVLYEYKVTRKGVTCYYTKEGKASTGDPNDDIDTVIIENKTTAEKSDDDTEYYEDIVSLRPRDHFANTALSVLINRLSDSELESVTDAKALVIANKAYMFAKAMMVCCKQYREDVSSGDDISPDIPTEISTSDIDSVTDMLLYNISKELKGINYGTNVILK